MAISQVTGEDHLAHDIDAIALEEHVFRAGQADAHGPEGHGVLGLLGGVGVGADLELGGLGAPFHELDVALEFLRGLRLLVVVE